MRNIIHIRQSTSNKNPILFHHTKKQEKKGLKNTPKTIDEKLIKLKITQKQAATMRIYLDSNVFISYIREEIGAEYRLLGEEAEQFFSNVRINKHILLISELFIKETQKHCFMEKKELQMFFEEKEIHVEFIEDSKKICRTLLLLGPHYSDAIHATNAINNKCDAIATFNIKDFEKIRNKINIINITQF